MLLVTSASTSTSTSIADRQEQAVRCIKQGSNSNRDYLVLRALGVPASSQPQEEVKASKMVLVFASS